MKRLKNNTWVGRTATAGAAVALAFATLGAPAAHAADAATCGPLTSMSSATVVSTQGIVGLVMSTMKSQGFDKKYNLDVQIRDFLNPPAMHAALIQRAVDMGWGGLSTTAVARANGSDVFLFAPLASPTNGVFVRKDSDIKSLSDLKGRKLGSFGGTAGATFAILSTLAAQSYGIPNLAKDAEVVVAPDAALGGLLDSGRIDAYLAGTSATVQAELSGKYRQLIDLSAGFEAALGTRPVYLAAGTTEAYAATHCGEVKAFSAALLDTMNYVKTHDEPWIKYAADIKMTDPRAPAALKARLGGTVVTQWNQKEVDGLSKLLESMIPILGEKDFISKVPAGLFSLDYYKNDAS